MERLRAWYERTAREYGKRPTDRPMAAGLSGRGRFFIDPASELEGFRRLALGRPSAGGVRAGERVLDVGTGTGRYLVLLARRGARCYGIDFSPAMLRELRKKLRGKAWRRNVVALRVGDARRLRFRAQRFEWVLCMGVLEYYPLAERRRILREIRRVLAPGGRAVIDMPDRNRLALKFQGAEQGAGNAVYLYERSTLRRLLRSAGFAVLREQRAGMERQFLVAPASRALAGGIATRGGLRRAGGARARIG